MTSLTVSPLSPLPPTSTRPDSCARRQHMEVHSMRRSPGTNNLHAHCMCHQGAFLVQALPQLPSPAARPTGGWRRQLCLNGLLGDGKIPQPSDLHLWDTERARTGGGGRGWVFWGSIHQEGRVTCWRGGFVRTMKEQRAALGPGHTYANVAVVTLHFPFTSYLCQQGGE